MTLETWKATDVYVYFLLSWKLAQTIRGIDGEIYGGPGGQSVPTDPSFQVDTCASTLPNYLHKAWESLAKLAFQWYNSAPKANVFCPSYAKEPNKITHSLPQTSSHHVHEKELLPELNPEFSPHIVPWCNHFVQGVDPQRVHHVEPVVVLCRSTWIKLRLEGSKTEALTTTFYESTCWPVWLCLVWYQFRVYWKDQKKMLTTWTWINLRLV